MASHVPEREHQGTGSSVPTQVRGPRGGVMLRPMSFLAALLWLITPSTPCRAQDQTQDQAQPQTSLADVARQARKDKEKNDAKSNTVITDNTLPSSKGSGAFARDLGGPQAR